MRVTDSSAIRTTTMLGVLLIGALSLYGQRSQSDPTPSLRDALRTAEPLRTAANLRNLCQAYVRIQSAQDANDPRRVKQTDFQEAGHCMGYVTGWMDTANEQLSCDDGRLYALKFIGEPTVSQVIKVFLMYTDSHPERNRERATHILERALGEKKMIGAFAVDFSECKQ